MNSSNKLRVALALLVAGAALLIGYELIFEASDPKRGPTSSLTEAEGLTVIPSPVAPRLAADEVDRSMTGLTGALPIPGAVPDPEAKTTGRIEFIELMTASAQPGLTWQLSSATSTPTSS